MKKTIALFGLLATGLASPVVAAADQDVTQPAAKPESAPATGGGSAQGGPQAAPAGPVHYDFEDDQVEGDIQRPDGELISSISEASQKSLIEIRRNFIPEMVKMIDDLDVE